LGKERSSFKKLWDIKSSFSVAAPNDEITRLLLLVNLLSVEEEEEEEEEEVRSCCCY
jgi:anti-anti-sigma regulatory factor